MKRKSLWIALGVVVTGAMGVLVASRLVCLGLWLETGICLAECPDGKLVPVVTMEASDLRRGAPGEILISVVARYATTKDEEEEEVIEKFDARLALVDAAGKETELKPKKWKEASSGRIAEVVLPDVPDGDYVLRAKVGTRLGAEQVDAKLPLYAPARVHVLTDRPLYEPGNLIRFRAVVLRTRDLSPLDNRPGVFKVTDPSGEVLLEEKAPAGAWGVAAGTFPLDREAEAGTWRVAWESGDARDEVSVTVEPFTLPRFRVEATAGKPFYRPGDKPDVAGAVIYSSGAPVANARVELAWSIDGAWPPPADWMEKVLPKEVTTDAGGRFKLDLPVIPADLTGMARLTGRLAAHDPAGDRVEGAVAVLLSQDGIQVSAVTELADGLVDGFNNRIYVRVTTPDGGAVEQAQLTVRRSWDPGDKGVVAPADEDGVAALQIDPGPPVNVVIPPPPYRAPPRPKVVTRDEPRELLDGEGASLADQVEMDRWLAALERCAKWVDDTSASVTVALRVDAGGFISAAAAGPSKLEACVLGVVRGRRLPAGSARLYAATFYFGDPDLPDLNVEMDTARGEPEGLGEAIQEAARGARDCLPDTYDGQLPRALAWQARAGSKDVQMSWVAVESEGEGAGAAAAQSCTQSRIGRIVLDEEAEEDGMGLAWFTVEAPSRVSEGRPQATTMLGYELIVEAVVDGKPIGSTKLRLQPGSVPALRLRATPILATAGAEVTVEALRGPDFRGELPKELTLDHTRGQMKEKLDANTRTARFKLDPAVEGWCVIQGGGARALVYVKPRAALAVTVTPERETYAPGEQAKLKIATRVGEAGGAAAVGLFGVDESLGQLVPLPGAEEMARVRSQVVTAQPAFGVLDGQALASGRIRGANAAAATVARVSSVPVAAELDVEVDARAETQFDAEAVQTDRFYVILAELHVQTRAWEQSAPPGEKMAPPTMARLWKQALAACEKRGEKVTDIYGRRMRLHRLPSDLLPLTDPRVVVADGTRLPEDVENWAEWVEEKKP